ncbi:Glutamine--fructose-6-phosphate aminotransferase [isomerizing] [Candidatus Promineifilum breve]|uniref:Glutamine--fructose-6-phosphate aminotransferase [isomerizing] n=1 Tax=Candidatus Promineifilum breve TaxID=1806508 RepID=A0A160SYC0_9CHLR|nr:glutamine--fructose-6-phosphate transaminase (isomerizing) [Candidatus Promineifilum breve]CUS02451.2 Glutamine--fructose-6-phosphate aminotransferase [isomerizing] [Candidatus Promineifilum breve]
MCGIVGYIGPRQAPEIVLQGLKRLEYRGYDSAGIAALGDDGAIAIRRDVGKLANLEATLAAAPLAGHVAIGHTRWATHGAPTQRNAHPHLSMNGRVVLVHNGIVENFKALRDELTAEGVEFRSETDTEVIVQLAERYMAGGQSLEEAARHTLGHLEGANAVVLMSADQPDRIVCARIGNAGGITLGLGEGEMFIASDIPAILEYTRQMIFLESRQMAVITAGGYRVMTLDGRPVAPERHTIAWDPVSAVKGEYKHFMQKEIFEQPRALIDTLGGRVDFETGCVTLPEMNLTPELVARLNKLIIVACGTSYYAGLVGKFMIETIARLPVEVEYASEFRYYNPIIDERTAVLSITQSGETADTLAAAEQARGQGATLWAIVNAIGSQSMRLSDGAIPMHAGPEIGVASTKAFTSSLADLYLLACALGEMRGLLTPQRRRQLADDVAHLPALVGRALEHDAAYQALAERFHKAENFLFLGRGINYPIALEGALKLKEISYIHAEGYPAGEMKHGPIALIDESMPVLAIVTKDALYDKMISQVQQAKARGGVVIALATEGDEAIRAEADHVIYVPETPPLLAPIVNVVPLQLLSYHIAVRRGADVDQPRNLAKSVTVE